MNKPASGPALLSVRGLCKTYRERNPARGRLEVEALRGVDLEVAAGETLAVTGPSGSGKSTLARCIAGLEKPTSGSLCFEGREVTADSIHRRVQMVFQDPGASINPRFSVGRALLEPALLQGNPQRLEIGESLQQVGLPPSLADSLASQLSGGQKARLALARAIAALRAGGGSGAILILDESLSSLDLLVRAQIVNLLIDLREVEGLTYILITHDLHLANHLSDEVVSMREGKIVERRRSPIHCKPASDA